MDTTGHGEKDKWSLIKHTQEQQQQSNCFRWFWGKTQGQRDFESYGSDQKKSRESNFRAQRSSELF